MTKKADTAQSEYVLGAIEDAIHALPYSMCIYDADDRLLACSKPFRKEFNGQFDGVDRHVYASDLKYEDMTAARIKAHHPEDEFEARYAAELRKHRSKDDYIKDMRVNGRWVRRAKSTSSTERMVGIALPIDEIVERNNKLDQMRLELEHQATHDPLTDLPNRRALSEHLGQVFNDRDELLAGVAVLHVDLDKFKLVNDTLGHDAGDKVLLAASKILRSEVRHSDMVARVGGDEFVLICKNVSDEATIAAVASRIVEKMAKPIYYGEEICQIGASIGVVICREHRNPDQILMDADIALYEAKRLGRGRFEFFYPSHREQFTATQMKIVAVREAIALNAFEPYFQPQVCILSGDIIGLEALARWNDREHGILPPSLFLRAIEDAHLANELDAMMMRKTLRRMREWEEEGLVIPRVSLNLSTDRLSRATLVDEFKWACDDNGISYDRICIEIMETVTFTDENSGIIENIRRLSDAGFNVALDDFGTGQASISGLRDLRPNEIKIDQGFVQGIDQDDELKIITGAIIALATMLGIDVLCEGVETQGELDQLTALGCNRFQGFATGKPMPSEIVPIWMKQFEAGLNPLLRVA